jgi:hypothetical protein
MEPLWSPAVATRGNRWQMGRPQERLKQAKTVAAGCDRFARDVHGKKGVDGSSPSEGFRVSSCSANVAVVWADGARPPRRPRSVHQRPPWTLPGTQLVEQVDRVLASVAGEVAVSSGRSWSGWRPCSGRGRRWRCRHGARRLRRCAGDRRPCAGARSRLGALCRLPLTVAEVVQVEVAARLGRKEHRAVRARWLTVDRVQRDRLERHCPPARLRLRALEPTLHRRGLRRSRRSG